MTSKEADGVDEAYRTRSLDLWMSTIYILDLFTIPPWTPRIAPLHRLIVGD